MDSKQPSPFALWFIFREDLNPTREMMAQLVCNATVVAIWDRITSPAVHAWVKFGHKIVLRGVPDENVLWHILYEMAGSGIYTNRVYDSHVTLDKFIGIAVGPDTETWIETTMGKIIPFKGAC